MTLAIWMSASIARKMEKMKPLRGLEPRFSGSSLFIAVTGILLFLGSMNNYIMAAVLVGSAGDYTVLRGYLPYEQSRITTWHNPFGTGHPITEIEIILSFSEGKIPMKSGNTTKHAVYSVKKRLYNRIIKRTTKQHLRRK